MCAAKNWIEPIRNMLDHHLLAYNPGLLRSAVKNLLKEIDRLRLLLDEHEIDYDMNICEEEDE